MAMDCIRTKLQAGCDPVRRFGIYLALGCVAVAGCGRGHPVAPVSGRVTVAGAPVENVVVTFTPAGEAAEPGPGSFGRTDSDGRYSLNVAGTGRSGAVPGRHRVTLVYRDEAAFETAYDDSVPVAAHDGGLPPEARDGSIEFVVEPGGTRQADFEF